MTRETAWMQLSRLSGLPGFPKKTEAIQSLLEAALAFPDSALLDRFCADWLRAERKAPLPADLWETVRVKSKPRDDSDPKCTVCYDSGEVYAEFLVTCRPDGHKTRERLTPEQAAVLWVKHREAERRGDRAAMLQPGKQYIYEGPIQCSCGAKRKPEKKPVDAAAR